MICLECIMICLVDENSVQCPDKIDKKYWTKNKGIHGSKP